MQNHQKIIPILYKVWTFKERVQVQLFENNLTKWEFGEVLNF